MAHPLIAAPCYTFAVDIEALAEPHKIRPPLREKHALYHGKLAAALRNRGLEANAADDSNPRRPDGDNGWWISRNSSLGVPSNTSMSKPGCVCVKPAPVTDLRDQVVPPLHQSPSRPSHPP